METSPRIVDRHLRRALLLLVYLLIAGAAFALLHYSRPVIQFTLNILSPFIVALIVAYIFNPIVSVLQRRARVGRVAAVAITYAIILLITVSFFAVLLPILYSQLRAGLENLIQNLPVMTNKAVAWLKLRMSPEEIEHLRDFLKQHLNIDGFSDGAGPTMDKVATSAVGTGKFLTKAVVTSVSFALGLLAFISFVIVITFYFLLDYSRMEYVARVLLPDDRESRIFALWARIDRALGGFLRGQLLVGLGVGTLYTLALVALGMKKYAILIGFMAGFGNLIPYVGPIVGGVPTALWVIFSDRFGTAETKMMGLGFVLLLSVAIQSIDGFFLQPRIVGKNAELHPLLVLLALLIGAQFGLGGMVIAVPVAIIAKTVLKELWWDPLVRSEQESKAARTALPP
ncbi:MAG: AI-2E family transporter [Candidatus Sumerlaeaceae bacterium]